MAKLPKLTKGVLGAPIRHSKLPESYLPPPQSTDGCVRYIIRTTPNRQPVFYDSDELAVTTVTIVDDDYYTECRQQAKPPIPQNFTDNDESAPLGGFRLDEDDYRYSQLLKIVSNTQPLLFDDDRATPPAVEDDQWNKPYQQTLPSSRLVFIDNDEDWPLGGFRLEEDDHRHSQLIKLLSNIQPVIFDDDLGTPPTTAIEDDQWDKPYQQILPSSRLVFTDNDENWPLGGFRLDEDYWTYTTQPILRNTQPFIDTEEFFTIATPFGLEEDDWLWSLWMPQAIPYKPQPPITDQDEKEGIPQPPADTDVWHGRRRKEHERRKPWPLPPPAFPPEKQEEILTFGDTTKTAFTPRWIETISKKPTTEGRGLTYLPVPVDFIEPTFSISPPQAKGPVGISTSELDMMERTRRNKMEEETIISLLIDEDDN